MKIAKHIVVASKLPIRGFWEIVSVFGDKACLWRLPLGRGFGTEGLDNVPTIEGRAILKFDMISSQVVLLMLCS